jgi:hypothetical protein
MAERCLHNEVCKYGDKRSNGMYCTEEKCKQFKAVADFVEVVRCKDCKMRCPESVCIAKHCTLTGIPVDDDDFCSYGERREGE